MNIKYIDHIGIEVKSHKKASVFYTYVLDWLVMGTETVADQKSKVAFLKFKDTKIEFLEATHSNGPDGPGLIAKFIDARGEEIHHIVYCVENVEDIEEELAALKEKGIRLIDETPRIGAGGVKITFIHPKETNGVLTELCEH